MSDIPPSPFPASKNPYPKTRITEITSNRRRLHESLIIDNLLQNIAGLPPSTYPPKSTSSLASLYNAIHESTRLDTVKKHSFIYYLLLDYDHVFPSDEGRSTTSTSAGHHRMSISAVPTSSPLSTFQSQTLLPDSFIMLMTALWKLDNLQLGPDLMRLLCNPSVTIPDPSKALQILAEYGTPQDAIGFIAATQPVLTEKEDIEIYFACLCRVDVPTAFGYTRTDAPDHLREGLFKQLVKSAVEAGGEAAIRIVDLPLGEEEKVWFEEALKAVVEKGEKKMQDKARDALLIWWLHTGRYEDVVETTERVEARGEVVDGLPGVDWGVIGNGVRKGLGPRMEKKLGQAAS
ncbi:hypothetical protein EX30DRAFT_362079 [Ascodesmis nigricans]|uniref:ELYS-like domain-containing protein n=1 Tax=Ascodesmis nigricans TaxID=341454 RepID=A0A4S2N4H0_9PEZI|nr:hypothetical protein EX30DRAFT_362079 [Ascodesmis nigricans]